MIIALDVAAALIKGLLAAKPLMFAFLIFLSRPLYYDCVVIKFAWAQNDCYEKSFTAYEIFYMQQVELDRY